MGVFIDLDVVDKHYAVAKAACADVVDSPKTVEYGGTYSAVDPKGIPGSSPRRRRASPAGRLLLLQKAAWPLMRAKLLRPPRVGGGDLARLAGLDLRQSLVGQLSTLRVLP